MSKNEIQTYEVCIKICYRADDHTSCLVDSMACNAEIGLIELIESMGGEIVENEE